MENQSRKSAGIYNAPKWGDGARIQWYGERGIVNALVSHIASSSDVISCVKQFLHAIEWADGNHPAWIEKVTDARFLVEIGLADFGNPDLIVVCRTEGDELPYLVFIEAKARPYPLSAGSNKGGMTPGYNSTINGQLSLKYRFAQALATTTFFQPITHEISESQELFDLYQLHLSDYAKKRRHLLKDTVVETLQGLELIGLPEEHCHYVAFTWDDGAGRVFQAAPDIRPIFLGTAGNDRFDQMKPRYGWLGYAEVQRALALEANIEYQNACHGMLPYLTPKPEDYSVTRRLENLTVEEEEFISQVSDLLAQSCTRRRVAVERHAGSVSIEVDGSTIAKVIPGEVVFVGIRESSSYTADLQALPVQRRIQSVTFYGFTFPVSDIDLASDLNLKTLLDTVGKIHGR